MSAYEAIGRQNDSLWRSAMAPYAGRLLHNLLSFRTLECHLIGEPTHAREQGLSLTNVSHTASALDQLQRIADTDQSPVRIISVEEKNDPGAWLNIDITVDCTHYDRLEGGLPLFFIAGSTTTLSLQESRRKSSRCTARSRRPPRESRPVL